MTDSDDFERERPFLTGLAYRMLGSVQDAEDVVQEAWMRWQRDDAQHLEQPRAWFTTTISRLCVDRLRRQQRAVDEYPGEWLPEPWIDGDRHERDDTLSVALLSTIRKLPPTERAVFLLHDVFGYAFDEVAPMLELQPANCRQLAARARRNLRERPAVPRDTEREQQLGHAFFAALREGDIDGLQQLLHEDVVLRSDGGGKVAAVHYPLRGRDAVLRFLDRLLVRTGLAKSWQVRPTWFNGAPGKLVLDGHHIESAYQFECCDGAITAIHVQRNPDKLGAFTDSR